VFTGSGISVPAGLSTFSDAGGLYERARKRHKLRDGMDLFKYSFYNKNPAACNSFMAQIAAEIRGAKPTDTHRALAKLEASGRLRRHVTMNIDGLAHDAGMSTWSPDCHQGTTLELHGTAREVVCTGCGHRATASKAVTKQLKDTMPVICESCGGGPVRWRVLLYGEPDDEQSMVVDPGSLQLVEADAVQVDLIVWAGISFEQSATTEYFKLVQRALVQAHRNTPMAIINPAPEALFNIQSSVFNVEGLDLLPVNQTSDTAFESYLNSTC